MDKEYALGKDGLPLTINCNYLKIAKDDLPLVKSLLEKNNISYKDNVEPYDFFTEHEVQSTIIYNADANCDLDIDNLDNQKKILNLLEKTNVVEQVQTELDLDDIFYDLDQMIEQISIELEDDELYTMLNGIEDSKED